MAVVGLPVVFSGRQTACSTEMLAALSDTGFETLTTVARAAGGVIVGVWRAAACKVHGRLPVLRLHPVAACQHCIQLQTGGERRWGYNDAARCLAITLGPDEWTAPVKMVVPQGFPTMRRRCSNGATPDADEHAWQAAGGARRLDRWHHRQLEAVLHLRCASMCRLKGPDFLMYA